MPKAAVLAVLLASSIAHAGRGGAILVPPAEVDVGVGATSGDAVTGPSTDVLCGIHWASLYWHPTPVDIGIGYVGSIRSVLPGFGFVAREAEPTPIDNKLRLNGGYFDLAYSLESKKHWRTWLAARGELLSGTVNLHSFSALGYALRINTEVFGQHAFAAAGRRVAAALAGTFALGVYVEASHRDIAPELGPNELSAGISMRVPFIAAIAD